MTDEERKKLCEWLRGASVGWSGSSMIEPKMAQAADEIERLAKELDQAKRHDMRDWYSALECGRKNPI